MKKLFTFLFIAATFAGCSYDDGDLWNKVNDLDSRVKTLEQIVSQYNTDIASLQTVVNALNSKDLITGFTENATKTGWLISFQSGAVIEILHGTAGSDAPVISVKKEESDGLYYWTLDGEPILDDDGKKIPVTGAPGEPGKAAVAPVIGIDNDGYWTIDVGDGNGPQRIQSNGKDVMATDDNYQYLFTNVEDKGRYYIFHLADGTTINVVKRLAASIIIDAEPEEYFQFGQERMFSMKLEEVADATASGPRGWTIFPDIDNDELWVQAPASGSASGTVRVTVYGTDGASSTASFRVKADTYRLKTVTFEGAYWEPFVAANYNGGTYTNAVHDNYNYPLWVDATTQLTTDFPTWFNNDRGNSIGFDYPWILSSYNTNNISPALGWYQTDLYIYNPDNADATTGGGRNGSNNFLVAFGYMENGPYSLGDYRPVFKFADGKARTIKSMYINSTLYFLSVVAEGNSLSPALAPGESVWWEATGIDANGDEIGTIRRTFASYEHVIKEWTEWDISELGPIVALKLNQGGGTDNGYGYSLPAYYAIDDITVVLDEE
ncbi:MAG: DUF4988 and DUF4465 domain-containing protein [Tannerella sp.]|jgi:hypothetical protein|nr:DUF4988 and DUF4465 domain-containing protein [Tannerella sp.]